MALGKVPIAKWVINGYIGELLHGHVVYTALRMSCRSLTTHRIFPSYKALYCLDEVSPLKWDNKAGHLPRVY